MRKILITITFSLAAILALIPLASAEDTCDFWYDRVLVPQCQEDKTRQCWEGINQWYADCKAGKVKPPMEHVSRHVEQ
ncbi:hypothetical protein [Nocardia cyriacigeorgica]|uniref:Uncharacterized protein n=1 Tax=Nocardia cyriacigeorgica TaxID=135487 RepID=A0A4U8W829_9NOCA|nr:hypothetical protein [Nocardia cyriacigeorgica]MBF6161040.1 hypothetical protein [Nocardia cyriacigeorgica]MBF6199839.1 hypothetical protein [Nocardia cyriacigeorgica]VFB01260.1 Uncharacterised protein [Nocardia cyriacigeorgica]